jgi:broad specificity phosphatase PhoE
VPTILLARHGQASFGAADYDVLSDAGRKQATLLAADLTRRGVHVARVVSGTMLRQRATAEALGQPVEIDARWDEYDADDILAAHSGSEVRLAGVALEPREFQGLLEGALRGWIEAGAGGPAREPWSAFAERVAAALAALAGSLSSGETTLVATSGGVIAAIGAALLGADFAALNRVAINTGVTTVVTGRGGTTLISFNEHAHLPSALVTYR